MKPTQNKNRNSISLWKAIWLEIKSRINIPNLASMLDKNVIIRFFVTLLYVNLLALLQTTFFSKFALFGATPDLILPFIAAIAITEGKIFGGGWGLYAALIMESLGGTGSSLWLLPLLYMPVGYFIGLASEQHFKDTIPVRLIYISICGVARAIITATAAMNYLDANLVQIFGDIVIPEFFSTLIMSFFIHFIIWLSYKPFHKSRQEMTNRNIYE